MGLFKKKKREDDYIHKFIDEDGNEITEEINESDENDIEEFKKAKKNKRDKSKVEVDELKEFKKNKVNKKGNDDFEKFKQKQKGKHKKLNTWNFYVELLFSIISKGNLNNPTKDDIIPEGHFYYSTNKIFTKDKVKKVFFIDELPTQIEDDFLKELKYEVGRYCDVNIIQSIEPYYFYRDSYKVKRRINLWKQRVDTFQKELAERDRVGEIFEGNAVGDYFDRNTRMIKSWQWVNDTEKNRDNFCKYRLLIELVADNIPKLTKAEEALNIFVNRHYIIKSTIFVQTNDYYKAFSIAGNKENNYLRKSNQGMILSDNIVSQFAEVSAGMSGDEHGLYLGTDVITSLPITYDVKKGSDAIVFLLSAATGEGKSGASKTLLTHLEIENLCTIIVDYEGDEYTAIGKEHDAKFVSMNSDDSCYFDTTEIGDLTGDPKIDKSLKEEAISTTKLVFDVMTDYENGMTFNEVSLFNDMILRVYAKRGVTEDPQTWNNSKGCSYEELYRELLIMENEPEYIEMRSAIKDFITKLRLYFDGNLYSGMFQNRLSINDIQGHKNIIFTFGMRGKTENTIDKRSLALRQLFVGYITILICNYNKTVMKKLTYVAWEEIQRYLGHEASGKIINDIVSGGRKRNMIVFLITNNPLQILDVADNDSSELAGHAKSIKSNIKGYLIGRFPNEITDGILKSVPELAICRPEFMLLNKDDSFKHCFILAYKNEYNLVKFEIPMDLWDSPLYVTRTDQED